MGGARTALYNWLFARHTGGTFLLRIEDTDAERNRAEWVDGIYSALRWLGLDWDGEVVHQSQRMDHYAEAVSRLQASGHLYFCGCTRDEIDARTKDNPIPGYDGHCRDLGLVAGPGRALRFRVPSDQSVVVDDVVRGPVTFSTQSIEDFIVVKSSGAPLFVLAVVVDDMDMGITHVIRGEEHLPTTPKAILLWQALGGSSLPRFAHLPILVNEKRQKLSKRRDPVALEDYRAQGYLAEPLRNYLALLGWAPGGDREVLSLDEMTAEFRLDQVNHSPAFFDVVKLSHFNGAYIRQMDAADFVAVAGDYLKESADWAASTFDSAVFEAMAPLVQERVDKLADVEMMVDFMFLASPVMDQASWDKAVSKDPTALAILDGTIQAYRTCAWESEVLKETLAGIGAALDRKLGKAQAPVRVAVTGRTVGPPLFESCQFLGRDRVLARLEAARARLAGELGGASTGPPIGMSPTPLISE